MVDMRAESPPKGHKHSVSENPPQLDAGQALHRLALEGATRVTERLRLLDNFLVQIDSLLDELQPMRSGRIRINFEGDDNGIPKPTPAVYVFLPRSNKWRYRRVGANNLGQRAKKVRHFYDNRHVVGHLLSLASEIMGIRAGLILSVTNFKKSTLFRSQAVGRRSENLHTAIMKIHGEIAAGQHRLDFSSQSPDSPNLAEAPD